MEEVVGRGRGRREEEKKEEMDEKEEEGEHKGRRPLGCLSESLRMPLGSFLEASWGVLEASWVVWGPSWASRGDLSAILAPLGLSGRPPEAALARFGAFVGEGTAPEAHATHPESARQRPVAPGAPGNLGSGPLRNYNPRPLGAA